MKLRTHAETLKQKIAALGNRLRRYHKRTQRYRQNNLFTSNQREFFRDLQKDQASENTTPPKAEEMRKYWSDVWSQEKTHNTEAPWIRTEAEECRSMEGMAAISIAEEDVRATVSRMKNWASPGVDSIHNYWWKSLPSTHNMLARFIRGALEKPDSVPEYFTHGITHLVPKKGDLKQPGNYRPITCLPSAYKILTSTIAFKISSYLKANNIMAWEQNGCKRKGRGSKELLVIDNLITTQAKKRLKIISMAWIDYQKAFDSVPHSWLLEENSQDKPAGHRIAWASHVHLAHHTFCPQHLSVISNISGTNKTGHIPRRQLEPTVVLSCSQHPEQDAQQVLIRLFHQQ